MSKASVLRVELGSRAYPIHIGAGLLDDPALFAPHVAGRLAAIVTNETVAPLYAARLAHRAPPTAVSCSRIAASTRLTNVEVLWDPVSTITCAQSQ